MSKGLLLLIFSDLPNHLPARLMHDEYYETILYTVLGSSCYFYKGYPIYLLVTQVLAYQTSKGFKHEHYSTPCVLLPDLPYILGTNH